LKWRHGLSPPAFNIRNVRHKIDPVVDKQKVHEVEMILKDLIETGFAKNCDEELIEFDDQGKLVNVVKGILERN
jgi:TATA-binding protein-associated factor Taf7